MSIKLFTLLCLASACSVGFAQTADDADKEDVKKCQMLAADMNKSKGVGISMEGMTRLVTWRAACAERPPVGRGNVTALCEGKRTPAKGGGKVFFWQKSDHGQYNTGYFACDD